MSQTKRRTNWKRVQAKSLNEALELCLKYAEEKQRLSIERIADLMAVNKWTLYKWIANANIPLDKVPAYEHICSIDFVTQYLANSAQKLLIEIPTGRKAKEMEINNLQASFADSMSLLHKFYDSKIGLEETIAQLTHTMSGLAWQREALQKYDAPELSLFGGNE